MKIYIFSALVALFAIASGISVQPHTSHKRLLGAKECTWGPSYWCQNLTSAAGCKAVKHCIQTVWIHKQLPPDTSSVCQTCLDMVKQARDQLLSNDTQELVKEVFEGSCALLHVKPVVKECDKVADEFIPELIDTLASEMNPQVVCSVAGLCNNERIHRMLEEAGETTEAVVKKPDTCEGCHTVIGLIEDKFNKMSRDEVLQSFLEVCGRFGSFSDGCSNIIVTYFNEIYNHLQENLNSNDVCLMAGECSAQFHKHAKVEITPISHIGYVPVTDVNDDLPCELCEQLVGHLRELLVANTTEDEFKTVLNGLCKQTREFSQECLSIVNQYYDEVYSFLVRDLNSTVVCDMIGICKDSKEQDAVPIAPLLPVESAQQALKITQATEKPLIRVGLTKDTVRIIPPVRVEEQLPIDLLVPPHNQVYNSEVCIFCEYFLHYVQETITSPQTEEDIKDVIEKACTELPNSVNNTCYNFINTYEPALVAILAQEIDPSQVCPLIKACPSAQKDVEIFMHVQGESKCPLCLFAVQELESEIKNKKTEDNIKSALNRLCIHLPSNLKEECQDFVTTYTNELVDLLIADLNPQEVCVYLKLCSDNRPASTLPPYLVEDVGGNVETNIIPDNTVNGMLIEETDVAPRANPQCVMCEFVMKQIEDQLKDKKTDAEIKNLVIDICNVMPGTIRSDCNNFVNQYADTIIQLLIQALEPSEICSMMKLCTAKFDALQVEIMECPVCLLAAEVMHKILENPNVDHDIEHVLEKTCRGLPKHYKSKCEQIIKEHGKDILNLIIQHDSPHHICKHIALCSEMYVEILVGVNKCTYGPSYWCQSEENADDCGARTHCETKVWGGPRPKRSTNLIGSNHCTWGPGYWCESEENADECGSGARAHCETKVWGGSRPKRNANLVGSNHCTRGPGYWCESEANADECGSGARAHCETKVWGGPRPKRSTNLLGNKHCTWGPGYWCESEANADECGSGARAHCESKVWGGPRPKRSTNLVGNNRCTWGPGYWCDSEANADECGSGAREHCESKVWGGPRPKRSTNLVGSNRCTWGPGYWCDSEANADECGSGAREHCESKVWGGPRPKRSTNLVGSNHCTRGPGYWCESEANADECGSGARAHCETKVWGGPRPKRSTNLVGSNHCTWGPGYWCESEAKADECGSGARAHCESKVWGGPRPKRSTNLVGSNHCTRGPGYWCESEANADECGSGARAHCETKVWGGPRPKRSTNLVGSNHCTRGPGYWCESEANADECGSGARAHCESKVWGGPRPKRSTNLVGSNHCTRGPGYWCESEANADECGSGARAHCETKVWGGSRPKRSTNLVGSNHCTWGPGYWCESEANADECGSGARAHCESKVWGGPRPKRSTNLLGSNHCTWGPGYWCESEANANECGSGARSHCETKVWGGPRPKRSTNLLLRKISKRSTQLLGSDHCTWGPSYWCESEQNADKCGARQHCESKVWGASRPKRRSRVVGTNRCTSGPGYWCQNESTANECGPGARRHCETKVWGKKISKKNAALFVGSNRCTRGPSYWCANEKNADECGARQHCEEKVWLGTSPKKI